MRHMYDDLDDFEFEFADSAVVNQVLRETRREQRRLASRRAFGPGTKGNWDEEDSYEDLEDYEDYEDYDEYDDEYDDDEFDSHSGNGMD